MIKKLHDTLKMFAFGLLLLSLAGGALMGGGLAPEIRRVVEK